MPISELENYFKNKNDKQFSNQTFNDFRQDLLEYANTFYKDNIVDFSEVSLGGMLLDFAAIVGDSLVYYAEQQFNELDYETATDPDNIVKHLQRANIKNSKASPSSVNVTFTIEVDRDTNSSDFDLKPIAKSLPVIKSGTTMISETGIIFTLQEDVDFSKNFKQTISEESADGTVQSLFLKKVGLCTSGAVEEEIIDIPNQDNDFFIKINLDKDNVTEIIRVVDDQNNEYHQVEYLSQTTVFKKVKDSNDNYIAVVPAAYRFIREENFATGKTSLRFGNGSGKSLRSNNFENIEDLLIPLKNKDTISKVSLDPSTLLESKTLGISPEGKTLSIIYKYGGGISHNVPALSINTIVGQPIMTFPDLSLDDENYNTITSAVIDSLEVINDKKSIGGTQPLTLEDLKRQIPNAMRSQDRIINHEDLLSRILTMPSDFGKINKAVALNNKYSTSFKDLFIVCKDDEGFYSEASDALKTNLSSYLNEYRLIGDNFNILDVPVYNFGIRAKIKIKKGFDVETVLLDVNTRIVENMRFDLMQIGSPISINQIAIVIENTDGVDSIITPRKAIIVSKSKEDEFFDIDFAKNLTYNDNVFNPSNLFDDGLIYPPRGGIFEMRYTFKDIFIAAN